MPSRRFRRTITAALEARARGLLGHNGTALLYTELWLMAGRSITLLARDLGREITPAPSRGFVSTVVNRLEPDARERIAAARRAGRDPATCIPLIALFAPGLAKQLVAELTAGRPVRPPPPRAPLSPEQVPAWARMLLYPEEQTVATPDGGGFGST